MMWTMTRGTGSRALASGLLILAALAMAVGLLLAAARPAYASTFEVNTTADDDDGACVALDPNNAAADCTLREAINAANANNNAPTIDTINFQIPPAGGVKTIFVGSTPTGPTAGQNLPNITEAVTINGYSQSGASENTNDLSEGSNAVLTVELDGSNVAGSTGVGLRVFKPGTVISNVVIKGLVINRFSAIGIIMTGFGSGNRVEGSFIGTDPTGTMPEPNGPGSGVSINGFGDTVGGTSPAARNVISGNTGAGIDLAQSGAKVQGNYIGTEADGTSDLGNTSDGVVAGNNNATIGGADSGAANVIAFNGGAGVRVSSVDRAGNHIINNSIHSNDRLGIDLSGGTNEDFFTRVTPNDRKDRDTGANNLQNFPTLISANTDAASGTTKVTGKLKSQPRKTFTIQLFSSPTADPSGNGEGKTFLGQVTKKTNREGKLSFSFTTTLPTGENVVTATATRLDTSTMPATPTDTSEFSNSVTAS